MSASAQKRLLELADKRLEKFVSLLPRVLVGDRSDTIHDTRVYSRRLQQVIRVFFPNARAGKTRKLIRTLRRTRRCLGPVRNLDVTIELVQKTIHRPRDATVRDAWRKVRQYLEEERSRELLSARREIEQHDVMAFIERARSLFESDDREKHPEVSLKKSIEQSLTDWYEALDNARQNQGQESFHAFRIAGKRLRYRLELLAAMGDKFSRTKVKALKKFQDEIGQWHDRQILRQFVADFIAQPDFRAYHPELARALLAEMDAEHQRDDAAIATVLKHAQQIRDAWAPANVKRRARKGNGVDEGIESLDSRASDRQPSSLLHRESIRR